MSPPNLSLLHPLLELIHPSYPNFFGTAANFNLFHYSSFLGIKVHIHVTPYQMKDTNRPWIKAEEKKFRTELIKNGANVTRVLHSDGKDRNIDIHFNVLKSFKSVPGEK